MNRSKLLLTVLSVIIISNCTQTKVVSFTDPDAYGKVYTNLCIVANVEDLSDRSDIEERLARTMQENGINAISSISILPPTRSFTVEEENVIFNANNVDALAVIQIDDSGYHVTSEPFSFGKDTYKDDDGNKVEETTVSGGGIEQKLFSQFRISLVEISSGKTMWIGDADTQSNFDSIDPDWDMNLVLKGFSKKIVKELLNSGLVK